MKMHQKYKYICLKRLQNRFMRLIQTSSKAVKTWLQAITIHQDPQCDGENTKAFRLYSFLKRPSIVPHAGQVWLTSLQESITSGIQKQGQQRRHTTRAAIQAQAPFSDTVVVTTVLWQLPQVTCIGSGPNIIWGAIIGGWTWTAEWG